MKKRKSKKRKKKPSKDLIKTTISLPVNLWKELKLESIEKRKTLGELITEKLKRLERLEKKARLI